MVATYKKVELLKKEKLPATVRGSKITDSSLKTNVVTSEKKDSKAEVANEKPKNTLRDASGRSVIRRTDKKGDENNTRERGGKRCK